MTDKRVQQFFQLTERSIQGGGQKLSRALARRLLVLSMLMIGGALYMWQSERVALLLPWLKQQSVLAQKSAVQVVATQSDRSLVVPAAKLAQRPLEPNLKSQIPVFHLAAVRQMLQAVPLRRAALLIDSQEEDVQHASMVVMDKVIVMPKRLSNATQVA